MDEVRADELAARTTRLAESAIGSILRFADAPDMITLAAGGPAAETFCGEEVAAAVAELLATGPGPLQYGDTSGLWELREWIAQVQAGELSRPVEPAEIVLTHGSQQAVDLLCKALLDPGAVVVVDRPSYVGALQVFNLYQATIVAVPIAADAGLDALRAELDRGLRPKLLYIVPNFANPTGLTLSGEQRLALLDLAARHGFVIVEDDPYGDLWLTDRDERPLALAAGSGQVIRLGSFSKVLFPAARLGYAVAPRPIADVLSKLKQAADLGNSHFVERIVHELVRRPGFLTAVLARSRAIYRERREVLIESLRTHVGEHLSFARPDGGFFLWARMPAGADAGQLLTEALAVRVSFVPGAAFYPADPDVATLRLSYSCATPDQLAAAGPRLSAAFDRLER